VTNCSDTGVSGDGSLRGEIAAASPGDIIAFSQDCTGASAIILATGTLTLGQDVPIDGSGHTVVVDGGCTGCELGGTPSGGVTIFTVTRARLGIVTRQACYVAMPQENVRRSSLRR
jgi:hypothetical protein